MKDDLKILKAEYLSNGLLDPTNILKISLNAKKYCTNTANEDDFQWKTTSKSGIAQYPLIGPFL
jgi:hypothetical protein